MSAAKECRLIEPGEHTPDLASFAAIPSVSGYLRALSAVCLEVAREPRLLGTFLGILRLAGPTLAALPVRDQIFSMPRSER